jgi:hypothetical protein
LFQLRLIPIQHMHMRYAYDCMHGDIKIDVVNACVYLYVFCNLQHTKKNLLTASHGTSASYREKCTQSFQNTCLSLIPDKMDAEIHVRLVPLCI